MRAKFIYYFLLFVFFDQITKLIFASRDFFISPLHLHLVKNYGLSFGIDFGFMFNLVIIIFALGVFFYYLPKNLKQIDLGLALILSGAVSNLADRLIFGYVRDFIDLSLGFTFNLADGFIVIGLISLVFFGGYKNQTAGGNQDNPVE